MIRAIIHKWRELGTVVKLPSSGNYSKSTTMAQRINLKLKCTWVMQQDKDPETHQQVHPPNGLKKTQLRFWSGFVKVRIWIQSAPIEYAYLSNQIKKILRTLRLFTSLHLYLKSTCSFLVLLSMLKIISNSDTALIKLTAFTTEVQALSNSLQNFISCGCW